jgi:hypothetical protein
VPWSRVLSFDDPFALSAAIRGADWQVYPTKKGQLGAELTQVTLHQLWIQNLHQELPQIRVGTVVPNRKVIGFLTELHQPTIHHRGEEVSPCDVIVNTGDAHKSRRRPLLTAACHCHKVSFTLPAGR